MLRYESDHPTGVLAYGLHKGGLIVRFQKNGFYFYNNKKPGATYVKEMVVLAKKGSGLSGYISQHHKEVWENYFATGKSLDELLHNIAAKSA